MSFNKRLAAVFLASLFFLSLCPSAFAQVRVYNVEELEFDFSLPDTWTVATKTNFDEEFIEEQYEKDAEEWKSFMELYDYYLFAAVSGNKTAQYEICVSSNDMFDEKIDYSESYTFELELTAKASFKANEESEDSTTVYADYGVVSGDETKYIVFSYQDVDKDGNPVYGKLYHTVMNGHAIDFDLNAYEKLSDEYVNVFDEAVLSIDYADPEPDNSAWYELSERDKLNLTYAALGVLAIAFVAVIVIFILSKIKEKKQFDKAAEEARAASEEQEAEPLEATEEFEDEDEDE